jgi:hypothetical protein
VLDEVRQPSQQEDGEARGAGGRSTSFWYSSGARSQSGTVPYLPQQPGYNKRLRKLVMTVNWLIRQLAMDTSLWSDDVWVIDSTPIECARSATPSPGPT